MMKRFHIFFLTVLLLATVLPLPLSAAWADVTFTFGDVSGKPGELVNVDIRVSSEKAVNSLALYDLSYDKELLTFIGFDNYGDTEAMCLFGGGFDSSTETVILALQKSELLDTFLGSIRFRIKKDAADTSCKVTMTSLAKNNADVFSSTVTAATVTVTGAKVPDVHTHSMKLIAATEPTCLYSGNIAHWHCTSCQKNYLDADGKNEAQQTVLPTAPNRHIGETVLRGQKEPQAASDGYTGDIVCGACGQILDKGTVILAAGTDTTPWDNPFDDISDTDRFYGAVRYVYENGLFLGTSENQFSPDTTMTRAMFVTVLGRLSGMDPHAYQNSTPAFDDVTAGQWYTPYVAWATEQKIILGRGDGTFGTEAEITVEQAAAIIARYARYTGKDTASQLKLTHTDAASVSAWAADDMKWVVENRIYTGDDRCLYPLSAAKRALVADMLFRYTETFK